MVGRQSAAGPWLEPSWTFRFQVVWRATPPPPPRSKAIRFDDAKLDVEWRYVPVGLLGRRVTAGRLFLRRRRRRADPATSRCSSGAPPTLTPARTSKLVSGALRVCWAASAGAGPATAAVRCWWVRLWCMSFAGRGGIMLPGAALCADAAGGNCVGHQGRMSGFRREQLV